MCFQYVLIEGTQIHWRNANFESEVGQLTRTSLRNVVSGTSAFKRVDEFAIAASHFVDR